MAEPSQASAIAERIAAATRPAVENVVHFRELDSTQSCALRLIDQASEEELSLPTTLIVADRQTAGRGRNDRRWESPDNGLYLSWVACDLTAELVARLPMVAAAAAATAMDELGVENVGIKWPNDLLVNGRKIAGVLTHARHGSTIWAAVGLGVNLHRAPNLDDDAMHEPTSVADEVPYGGTQSLAERIAGIFVRELAAAATNQTSALAVWRARLVHGPGDRMRIRRGNGSEIEGRFVGLTDAGHLCLAVNGEEHVIAAGDVVEHAAATAEH